MGRASSDARPTRVRWDYRRCMADTPKILSDLAADLADQRATAARAYIDTLYEVQQEYDESVTAARLLAASKRSAAVDAYSSASNDLAVQEQDLALRIADLQVANEWQPEFPGDTLPGTLRWGCSYQSNSVPEPHETAAGVSVGVRRTFWRIDQVSKIVATAAADIAAGRVPWVSVKLNRLASWAETAAGKIDTQILDLIFKLGALPGPVWLTMHHEPEGGNGTPYPDEGRGSEQHWRAMQAHVRTLLDRSEVTNIAYAPILMAWTFSPSSGRNPADWWVDGIWDFAGIDNYVEASTTTVRTQGWNNAVEFYSDRGLRIGVGEWGNKDHGDSGASEMSDWYDHLIDVGSPGVCYFDTSLNGGVPLSGAALSRFRELMKDPRSVRLGS